MQILFIVNPKAGRGKALSIWPGLAGRLSALTEAPVVRFTEYPGHARELAAQAVIDGFGTVVSVGGDGTIREIINGLVGSALTLGVIPAGTGNDFARTMTIPANPEAALALLPAKTVRTIDLGVVNGEYFVNVGGVGFDAEVVNDVNTSRWRLRGGGAYALSVLKVLWQYHPAPVRIEIDGRIQHETIYIAAVANGKYYGGGMMVAPGAVPDDGQCELCLVKKLSKLGFLRAFPSVFKGKHGSHPAVSFAQGREIIVTSEIPLVVHADGEIIGRVPARFSLRPGALRVIVPA